MRESPFRRHVARGKGEALAGDEYGTPDYAVAAHGRARLEVTEMKAPATFTPRTHQFIIMLLKEKYIYLQKTSFCIFTVILSSLVPKSYYFTFK